MMIGGSRIGPEAPPYFIAEAGVNHNGDIERAEALVDAAARAGADAVKFQTYDSQQLVTADAHKAEYQAESTGEGTQYEMLEQYELDRPAHERLIDRCREQGIAFLSTPFDSESADMLSELGVPAIKLGSGELDNHPLLEHVAQFGLPMLISTGMGTMEEVRAAHAAIRSVAPDLGLCLLHCTSAYPCDAKDVNLRAIQSMAAEFTDPVGYSDHTTLVEMPALAVAAGASVVEKHFTLDSALPGPDHDTSLEPEELARAVRLTKTAGRARGTPTKCPTDSELSNRDVVRKSLHAAVDLQPGREISREDVWIARPADGLSPRYLNDLLGAKTTEQVSAGQPLTDANTDVSLD